MEGKVTPVTRNRELQRCLIAACAISQEVQADHLVIRPTVAASVSVKAWRNT